MILPHKFPYRGRRKKSFKKKYIYILQRIIKMHCFVLLSFSSAYNKDAVFCSRASFQHTRKDMNFMRNRMNIPHRSNIVYDKQSKPHRPNIVFDK